MPGVLFVGSVVLRGCLTSLVGLFHEQEQVIQGDALPVVRGLDEEEGVHERGQAAVAVSGMPVQLRTVAGAQDAHGGVPRVLLDWVTGTRTMRKSATARG